MRISDWSSDVCSSDLGLGCAVLLGASRKGFIGKVWPQAATPKQRLPGSLAAALVGLQRGVQIVRVHDVAETCQAVALWQAATASPSPAEDFAKIGSASGRERVGRDV